MGEASGRVCRPKPEAAQPECAWYSFCLLLHILAVHDVRIQPLAALESEYNKSSEENNGSGVGLVTSEPRANAAKIEPQKKGLYSDPTYAR